MLLLWARVDLGMMAMNGYSGFDKAPALLLSMRLFNAISRTLGGGKSYPLQRYSQCIGKSMNPLIHSQLWVNCTTAVLQQI